MFYSAEELIAASCLQSSVWLFVLLSFFNNKIPTKTTWEEKNKKMSHRHNVLAPNDILSPASDVTQHQYPYHSTATIIVIGGTADINVHLWARSAVRPSLACEALKKATESSGRNKRRYQEKTVRPSIVVFTVTGRVCPPKSSLCLYSLYLSAGGLQCHIAQEEQRRQRRV